MSLQCRWFLMLLFVLVACEVPDPDSDHDGVPASQDCNDSNSGVYPGADEICGDGIDQDCYNGDEKCSDSLSDWDGDGFVGSERGGDDCNDQRNDIYPGATEEPYDGIDQDCFGGDLVDVDEDGQSSAEVGGNDCNDSDPTVFLGAEEIPYDGVDQDCSAGDLVDVDGDGFASEEAGGDDCDDLENSIYPGSEELIDSGVDENCDGLDNPDEDQDGVPIPADCDDQDDSVHPGGAEVTCNDTDEDCDGLSADLDCDGQVGGDDGEDCDDLNPGVFVGAVEVACNEVDENCDGQLADRDCDGEDSVSFGGGDCNDELAEVHDNALEVIGNGVDDNCNGDVDERVSMGEAWSAFSWGEGSHAGRALAEGDLDGDGLADLAVGAPEWRTEPGVEPGAVFVLYGGPGGLDSLSLGGLVYIVGHASGDHFGESLSIGDVDGDEVDELIVGAPYAVSDSGIPGGQVYVFDGELIDQASPAQDINLFSFEGKADGDLFGSSLAYIGDVDDDGVGEVLIGAPGVDSELGHDVGQIYIFSGEREHSVAKASSASYVKIGNEAGGQFGRFVSELEDINLDGRLDFAIGAPGANRGAGRVTVMLGADQAEGWQPAVEISIVIGEEIESDSALGPVARGGDLNGDGLPDLLLSAPNMVDGRGMVFALFGPKLNGLQTEVELLGDADASFIGEYEGDLFGYSLRSGYLSEEQNAGIVVGAPGQDGGKGAAYYFKGQSGQEWGWARPAGVARSVWTGIYEGQEVGDSLTLVDADSDGWPDLVLGVPGDDTYGEDAGAAYVFLF